MMESLSDQIRSRYQARRERLASERPSKKPVEQKPVKPVVAATKPAPTKARKPSPPREYKKKTRICIGCKQEFNPSNGKVEYCSAEACREARDKDYQERKRVRCAERYARIRKASPPNRACPNCGDEFTPRNEGHMYCSRDRCQNVRRNENKRRRKALLKGTPND